MIKRWPMPSELREPEDEAAGIVGMAAEAGIADMAVPVAAIENIDDHKLVRRARLPVAGTQDRAGEDSLHSGDILEQRRVVQVVDSRDTQVVAGVDSPVVERSGL